MYENTDFHISSFKIFWTVLLLIPDSLVSVLRITLSAFSTRQDSSPIKNKETANLHFFQLKKASKYNVGSNGSGSDEKQLWR